MALISGMKTAAEYLEKTESATRKLFEGIDSYLEVIRRLAKYDVWVRENETDIAASLKAQRDFVAESFAHATLCGAVLQVAHKALECYSTNTAVAAEWTSLIRQGTTAVPFCCGRLVRGVPLGLVIYAARNQHAHFDDDELRDPNLSIFNRLATNHGIASPTPFRDPVFDLEHPRLVSFASNVTGLIEWRSYAAYENDIRVLLDI